MFDRSLENVPDNFTTGILRQAVTDKTFFDTLRVMLTYGGIDLNEQNLGNIRMCETYSESYQPGPWGSGRKQLKCRVRLVRDTLHVFAKDVCWPKLTGRIDQAIIYKHVSCSNDELNIPLLKIDVRPAGDGGDLTIHWSPDGIWNITGW